MGNSVSRQSYGGPQVSYSGFVSDVQFGTTPEHVNFSRITRLILDICNDAMRKLIQSKIGKGELLLTRKIDSCKQDIQGHLNASQTKIIFPQNNGLVKYDLLDITLMYTIVRNIFHEEIEPNSKSNRRWGKTTYANDTSLLAAIETIRLRRNDFFAHATSAKLKDSDFNKIWNDLETSVIKLSDYIDSSVSSVNYREAMRNLKTSSINPEIEQLSKKLLELECKCYRVDGKEKAGSTSEFEDLLNIRRRYYDFRPSLQDSDVNIVQTEAFLAHKFFVETRMFQTAEQFLEKHKIIILVGKEGSGKTEMAVHLMFKYYERPDFVVRKLISDPREYLQRFNIKENTLIFIDDVFEHCEGVLSEWWKTFNFVQEMVRPDTQKNKQCKVHTIFTTRPQKMNDAICKKKYKHPFLDRYSLDIDLKEPLNDFEKKTILLRKIEYASVVQQLDKISFTDQELEDILKSSSPIGFPLCAKLYACDKNYRKDGVSFFSNPQKYVLSVVKSIMKSDSRRKTEVLFVLILIHQIQNKPLHYRQAETSWEILCELQCTDILKLKEHDVKDLEDVVQDHRDYVKESDEHELQFIHPSVLEAVKQYFFETYRVKALEILPLPILFQNMQKEHGDSLEDEETLVNFICRLEREIVRVRRKENKK
uniref:Uncharacterized protein LOC111102103 n=1 Tax=Crassostrea virginica TaxID=6565 RepID=A0A8B8AIT4_CRAVI|nr:uncharacterized protein LOC111102103 [Crassostrea virginica]